ncbi:MAG: hypothetical protein R3281_18330, partial [Balneolaceae bacterium]|nr:hypothetical protein [Balneolaceae bacterium]
MPGTFEKITQEFSVPFRYQVCFTEHLFQKENDLFANLIQSASPDVARNVLFVLDEGMYRHHSDLFERITAYAEAHRDTFTLVKKPVVIPGGEAAKNDPLHVERVHAAINEAGLDRHSYVTVIGGGAVIDTAGYAAATAHRGIRTIRV